MKGNLVLCAILICTYIVNAQKESATVNPETTTTTVNPETTTTTVNPETTTPISTTTPAPLTSTSAPTPVPTPPTPTEGSWNITDGNITCIRADLKIRFKIPVEDTDEYILLFPNATTTGSNCELSNTTQLLMLHDEDNVITFLFEKDSGSVYIRNITLTVARPERPETFISSEKLFSVKEGNSYMCKSSSSVPLGNATMEIFQIHIQAFGGTEKDFGTVEECEADDTVNDAIPIAVACSLAALIIIVLIAYLVGRRRSRQKGYNSV